MRFNFFCKKRGIEIIENVERVRGENAKKRFCHSVAVHDVTFDTLRVSVKCIDYYLQKLEVIAKTASNVT